VSTETDKSTSESWFGGERRGQGRHGLFVRLADLLPKEQVQDLYSKVSQKKKENKNGAVRS
jgi:hypothetical protein